MITFSGTGHAMTLIASINALKETRQDFWPQVLTRILTELDEAGNGEAVTTIGRLLARLHGQLADKPRPASAVTGPACACTGRPGCYCDPARERACANCGEKATGELCGSCQAVQQLMRNLRERHGGNER